MQSAYMSFDLVWYETTILNKKKINWNLYFLSTLALVTLSTLISSWLFVILCISDIEAKIIVHNDICDMTFEFKRLIVSTPNNIYIFWNF